METPDSLLLMSSGNADVSSTWFTCTPEKGAWREGVAVEHGRHCWGFRPKKSACPPRSSICKKAIHSGLI